MQPFLSKFTYRNATEAVNLGQLIERNSVTHAPKEAMQRAMAQDSFTLIGAFKKTVKVHAFQGIERLNLPAVAGVAVAAIATGGYPLLGYATMLFSGTGTELSSENQQSYRDALTACRVPFEDRPMFTPERIEEIVKQTEERGRYGILGQPERLAGKRAEAAYDAGRGLAHAAWSGLAIGLNALLWVPRTAWVILHQATVFACAMVGAGVGVVRFCLGTRVGDRTPSADHSADNASPRAAENIQVENLSAVAVPG